MTNEEAITNLNIIREAIEDYVCNYLTDTARAQKILNALQDMEQEPSDTVSRGAFEQVIWERDVAIGQLKELGYGLGQKIELCEDCISRKAVLDAINNNRFRYTVAKEDACTGNVLWDSDLIDSNVVQDISNLPSVTPKSETVTEFADRCRECGARYGKLLKQKYGKWIAQQEVNGDDYFKAYDISGVMTYAAKYKCDKCGFIQICIEDHGQYNYCPHCGCRMVEPQESEE